MKNSECVLAIELLCAAQSLDLFTNMKPGDGTLEAYRAIREQISHLDRDRILSTDIQFMVEMIRSGQLLDAVEKKVGRLQ